MNLSWSLNVQVKAALGAAAMSGPAITIEDVIDDCVRHRKQGIVKR
jgi:hypothetical protein